MSRFHLHAGAPTMIIPRGTEVESDRQGQLSIRTPGNLVLQNSGRYGRLESLSGSIRIEADAEVEAVELRCPGACYIQGSLAAWKLSASEIHLEDGARAHVVLQEAERIDVGRGSRMVGNFGSEKELFLLFSRFARQVRSLPFFFGAGDDEEAAPEPRRLEGGSPPPSERAEDADELPEPLLFAHVLLERVARDGSQQPLTQRRLEEILELLRRRDLETLRMTYRTLLALREAPAADIRRAYELIERHFSDRPLGAAAHGG